MTRIQLRKVLGLVLATIGCWMLLVSPAIALTGPQVANQQYGYPYPNSPDCNEYGSAGCVVDQWAFYQGQCTSWTAFRLSQMNGFAFNNYYGGAGRWGDASSWGAHAPGTRHCCRRQPGSGCCGVVLLRTRGVCRAGELADKCRDQRDESRPP